MVKIDAKKDYYSDLGIDSTADLATINKAYKRLGKLLPLGFPPIICARTCGTNVQNIC